MSSEYFGYPFEDLVSDPSQLKSRSGVYVIWCKSDGNLSVLDVGESQNVRERVMNHDRSDCWIRNCTGTINYSATYTPNKTEFERLFIEQDIRGQTNPPCGER